MRKYLCFIVFLLFAFSTSYSQKNKEITKIIFGFGSCMCGECSREIIEINSNLNYFYYGLLDTKNIGLHKGEIQLDFWTSISSEFSVLKNQELGSKKKNYLRNSHPLIIKIYRGNNVKTFYNDIDALDEKVWKLIEQIINLKSIILTEKQTDFIDFKLDADVLNFINYSKM